MTKECDTCGRTAHIVAEVYGAEETALAFCLECFGAEHTRTFRRWQAEEKGISSLKPALDAAKWSKELWALVEAARKLLVARDEWTGWVDLAPPQSLEGIRLRVEASVDALRAALERLPEEVGKEEDTDGAR